MASQLSRLLWLWVWLGLGAAVGLVVGQVGYSPMSGLAIGSWAGITLWCMVDGFRANRMLRWMRDGMEGEAPRPPGFWGEVGYRLEKALRLRERETSIERARLTQFLGGIEASPNGVLLLDSADQIEWCSPVAAEQLGLDAQRDLRQPITNLVRSPEFVSYLKSSQWNEPMLLSTPGKVETLSLLVRAYGDGRKLVLSQDVTERLRSDAMRRDFVANVSHEIRTPLTVLAGFVETMRTLPLEPSAREQMLTLMQQQSDRMQALVADLLTLAQLEGGPKPSADRWHRLAPLVARAIDEAQGLSAGRHKFEFDLPEDLEIAGSEGELHSAVANLLTNAVRYTPTGGCIGVHWSCNGVGRLSVSDTGIGIAREHLPRLTERFYRVDGGRSRESGGTGLGLAIVKHVMQRHGGSLDVDSTLGKGSCFRLVFPVGRLRGPGETGARGD